MWAEVSSSAPHLLQRSRPPFHTSYRGLVLRSTPPTEVSSSAQHLLQRSHPPLHTSYRGLVLRSTPPTEVSSSAPHLLHSGLSTTPITWGCLRRVAHGFTSLPKEGMLRI